MPEHTVPPEYEQKFANFIKSIEHAKANKIDSLVVAQPWVLGDTYDELIESLSRLAEAGLTLHITGR
jgi:dihydrodipicolinate synthase/N-acetylneuraminate lyase